jgi:serine/threonine-protein kinase
VLSRFRVVRPLGTGGMGLVYEVERISDARPLALKLLRVRAPGSLARFAREAEIAAQVSHPNVVSIVDLDVSEAGGLFLVMELVRGTTLEQESARYGDERWAIPILHQIALGLAAIHKQGVVHRDLKPSNVLLQPGSAGGDAPIAKIADFGIASLRTDEDWDKAALGSEPGADPSARLTRTGIIMGTLPYMAPEVMWGARTATFRSDLYSFGIIAYQVLAKEYPRFEAVASADAAPSRARARSLARVRPELPAELVALVDRALSPEPGDRPSADELAGGLLPRQLAQSSGA